MALKGTLKRWNADRGFGFIAPASGGHDLFVHISVFPHDGVAPRAGEALEYEFGRGKDGRPCAIRAWRPGSAPLPGHDSVRPRTRPRARSAPTIVLAAIVFVLVAVAYGHIERWQASDARQTSPVLAAEPGRVVQSINATPFRCDGRTYCSQMTSCQEAMYFLQNCPGTKMDGNGDGIPCEQQWCGGSAGR
ncbi:MAG: excalibur calcium-binding domain-containing protein [Burkholderiaceae bacterium]|nr:excalibur calcium-binding domain-containing protein [Burkholderiaceae bacterium]